MLHESVSSIWQIELLHWLPRKKKTELNVALMLERQMATEEEKVSCVCDGEQSKLKYSVGQILTQNCCLWS